MPLPAGAVIDGQQSQAPDAAAPEASLGSRMATGAKNFVIGAGKGALNTVSSPDDFMRAHGPAFMTNKNFGFGAPADEEHVHQMAAPQGNAQGAGFGAEQAAEFLAPGGAEERLAKAAPEFLRPAARIAGGALSSGAVNKAHGDDFTTGALAGGATSAAGEAVRPLGIQLMRSGIGGGVNSNTARAVLDETRGVRPSTVETQVGGKLKGLNSALDRTVDASNEPTISMGPSRQPLMQGIGRAEAMQAGGLHHELNDMLDFLHNGRVTGEEIPENVPPRQALNLRRGFNEEFLGNRAWKQNVNPRSIGAGKQAYGGLSSELHEKVPGANEIDERIHNLIPAQQSLSAMARREPSIAGNVMGRMGARTGALTSTAMGAAAGGHERGLPGAILGGAAGMMVPEILSTPTAKMMGSRLLYSPNSARVARAGIVPFIDYLKQRDTGEQPQ